MSREMKNSGVEWIGEIPKEWYLIRMKSCIASHNSGSWGKDPMGKNGDVVCLRIADFDYSKFKLKDCDISKLTKRCYSKDVIKKLF